MNSYFAQIQNYNNIFLERETMPTTTWLEFIIQGEKEHLLNNYSTWRIVFDALTYIFLYNP